MSDSYDSALRLPESFGIWQIFGLISDEVPEKRLKMRVFLAHTWTVSISTVIRFLMRKIRWIGSHQQISWNISYNSCISLKSQEHMLFIWHVKLPATPLAVHSVVFIKSAYILCSRYAHYILVFSAKYNFCICLSIATKLENTKYIGRKSRKIIFLSAVFWLN